MRCLQVVGETSAALGSQADEFQPGCSENNASAYKTKLASWKSWLPRYQNLQGFAHKMLSTQDVWLPFCLLLPCVPVPYRQCAYLSKTQRTLCFLPYVLFLALSPAQ